MTSLPKNKQHLHDLKHCQEKCDQLEKENEQLKEYAVMLKKEKDELEMKIFDLNVEITKLRAGTTIKGKDLFS